MKAAVLEELRRPLAVRDVKDPECPSDGAIVRVEANGVCRSDWHAWMGDWSWVGISPPLPHVLGHEFAGVVEEVGPQTTGFRPGDRVVVPFSQGDGTCEYCRTGHENVCLNGMFPGFSYWGGYGRYVGVPRADLNLVPLPDNVGFVDAASMGCRFMTSFHGLVDQAQVRPGEWVAVHGCGGIGLAAIHIAAALGANPIAVDISDDKLNLAREMGAVATVNARARNAPGEIRDITRGGAHVSVDALGVAATALNSLLSLRKRGRHLQIGLTTQAEQGMISVPMDMITLMELQVIGSLGMPASRYPEMLRMIEIGRLKPGKMVTRTVPIEEASDVIAAMSDFATVGVTVVDRW